MPREISAHLAEYKRRAADDRQLIDRFERRLTVKLDFCYGCARFYCDTSFGQANNW